MSDESDLEKLFVIMSQTGILDVYQYIDIFYQYRAESKSKFSVFFIYTYILACDVYLLAGNNFEKKKLNNSNSF